MGLIKTYGKSIAAAAVAVLTVVASVLTDGHVTAGEGVQIAIAGATALSVYLVPQLPQFPQAKTGIAVVLAVLNGATALIGDGLNWQDLVNLAIAGLGVIAVGVAPAIVHRPAPPPEPAPAAGGGAA